ncbi:HAD family hydrolase [Amycolatopsis vancoresmycina]|uniref:Hydrolase of the HAD superfamily protein n=1 Tax=Amycolatopsis vancoresmycina DSM 44592 TaxID=1292037 RepID=R1I047_9PSEU|nr:HAD family phosphatase [Amycolatopsis vancoresmycina]EOD65906.1 hydrolase of the HAD superfamily protein [Amycolatopsis vancoresmycina DSM 44592]
MNWIVFDYGDVLSKPSAALPDLAAAMRAPLPEFLKAYWEYRIPYDAGSAPLEYWQAIGDAVGVPVDEPLSAELTRIDVEGWGQLEPASMALLEGLAEAGANLALLSNAPIAFGEWVRAQDWARHFRVTLFSGDVRCVKPDAKIFRLLLEELGAEPADCLFFDDRESNVEGARAVGLRAHVWNGADAARAWLD